MTPVTPNVPFVPLVGLPGNPSIALLPVSLTTLIDNVPLIPFEGAKYVTAPLFPKPLEWIVQLIYRQEKLLSTEVK